MIHSSPGEVWKAMLLLRLDAIEHNQSDLEAIYAASAIRIGFGMLADSDLRNSLQGIISKQARDS